MEGSPKFIVGIGASAGGLDALGRFLSNMPAQNGMSFVVIQHLSPDHKSFMVELLSRRSRMPVMPAEHGKVPSPDCVYLLPPRKLITLQEGRFVLEDYSQDRILRLPIDIFFRSLAEDKKSSAIGVILSGTGSDGSLGVRAIKEAGGTIMVQSEASAEFDGMPRSAIATGLADFIGRPEELPGLLIQFGQHPLATLSNASMQGSAQPESAMRQLLSILRERTGVDFAHYKPATIDRRIERRMSVQQIDAFDSYLQFLKSSAQESEILFNNLLICVTRFFRDRDLWETLEQEVLPQLLKKLPPHEPFRAWIPGCSTGEEAYSLAMVLADVMERQEHPREIKIFATDVSKRSLEAASVGMYTASMVAEIPPDRLARHFDKRSDGYQVNGRLRKLVLFARQDLLKDPPFSRMSFVCCRNLLIYFQPSVQSRVLQSLRHALKPEGVLVLGSSESTGEIADRFVTLNSRLRIYSPKPGARGLELPILMTGDPVRHGDFHRPTTLRATSDIRTSLDFLTREMIREYAPATFVVDESRELLHVFGNAGDYLRHPDGAPTNNILRLTSHNIASALGPALHRAARANAEFTFDNVQIMRADVPRCLRIRVKPLTPPGQAGRLFLIYLEEQEPRATVQEGFDFQTEVASNHRIQELENELSLARENLQATVEELETSNEELQAANEELVAANEELQSTNEELQSVNEELHTVNEELKLRVDEVINLSNDLGNMFTSANIGAAFVDDHLRLRKLASAMCLLTGITPSDVGAPIELLARQLAFPGLVPLLTRVRDTGIATEVEIASPRGLILMLRAAPYLNENGQTSGLLLTVVDVTTRNHSEARILVSERLLVSVLNSLPAHVAVLNELGVITHVNHAWERFARENGAGHDPSCGVGANYFEVCQRASGESVTESQNIVAGMKSVLSGESAFFELEYPCHSAAEKRWFHVHIARVSLPSPGLVITHTRIYNRPELFPDPPQPTPDHHEPQQFHAA